MPAPEGNKFAIGNSGKSKIFEKPIDLLNSINRYFRWCDKNPIKILHKQLDKSGNPVKIDHIRPYTIEGLSEYLGVTRQTLLNYQKEEGYEEYFDIIARAKQKIERQRIEMASIGVFSENFTKFLLINNSDYVDKVEQKNTSENVNYNVTLSPEEAKMLSKELEDEC